MSLEFVIYHTILRYQPRSAAHLILVFTFQSRAHVFSTINYQENQSLLRAYGSAPPGRGAGVRAPRSAPYTQYPTNHRPLHTHTFSRPTESTATVERSRLNIV